MKIFSFYKSTTNVLESSIEILSTKKFTPSLIIWGKISDFNDDVLYNKDYVEDYDENDANNIYELHKEHWNKDRDGTAMDKERAIKSILNSVRIRMKYEAKFELLDKAKSYNYKEELYAEIEKVQIAINEKKFDF